MGFESIDERLLTLHWCACRRDISHILVDSHAGKAKDKAPAKKSRFAAMIMKPPSTRKHVADPAGKAAPADFRDLDRGSVIVTGAGADEPAFGQGNKTVVIKTQPPPPAAPKPGMRYCVALHELDDPGLITLSVPLQRFCPLRSRCVIRRRTCSPSRR